VKAKGRAAALRRDCTLGFARERDSVTLSDVEPRALGCRLRDVMLALSQAHH
jgi:hypothetical protein